ncbi:J domain-containing protein [Herbinix luporum]|jgi:tetratricopeptide (TPR) repeat protein|uniref:Tetratricopeptide repeat protein n=1 Tax=Herbinix luporum TaxID=1679721 RepID=A0A0K8J6W3_9FIRM|nr:tetratricopeptide repeat protein [Herbinix luporum]CUH93366.1 hypothetical protein SD1D_1824 [Herbinix luporum]
MDKKIWEVLGIEETKDEEKIIQAYRDKLIAVNPEDDAKGFMQLRAAYEEALRFVNEPEQEEIRQEKNDVDLWIDKIAGIYSSLDSRRDEKAWEELFRDDICIGLDTSIEAREKLLVFLMDHYYLPHRIWKLMDREFDIVADKEDLYEIFPRNFIDYVVNQITVEGFLDFTLFDYKEGEEADEYIRTYFQLKSSLDENKLDDCQKIIDDLKKYQTHHPYEDVEKIRYYLLTDRLEEVENLAKTLVNRYQDDGYILSVYGKLKSKQELYDEASNWYQRVLELYPDYYWAKIGLVECLYKKKKYTEAKDLALKLLNQYYHDETISSYLIEINEILIQRYQEKLKQKQDNKIKLELAWCYFQNEKLDDCINLLEELPDTARREYDFINLYGRAYLALGKYDLALDKLKVWLQAILDTKKDDSEEAKKRYGRLGYAYYSIGLCYTNLQAYDEAVFYYQKSIEVEERIHEKLVAMERLAYTYLKAKNYKECIKTCENIIEISRDYYPAYLLRQEAFYDLHNDQEVINDYYRAVEIYPGYIRPYLYAIKVYIRHNQYEDAKAVAEAARKAGLESNEFKLLCVKLIRLRDNTEEEREEAIQECIKLKESLKEDDNDIEDPSLIDFELALLYAQSNQYGQALALIDSIIEKKPDEYFYVLIKAGLLKDIGKYKSAIDLFNSLLEKNPENLRIYYELGFCYYENNNREKALEVFHKILEINPEYANVNDKIADIYHTMLNETKKLEYYKKALPYADKQVEIAGSDNYYVNRGLLHMDAYEFDKALSDFYRALEINPDDWIAYNNAGCTHMFMRNMDKAIEILKEAVAKTSIEDNRLPYGNLAKCYYIIKEYDKALKYYEELHRLYPTTALYIEYISEIYKIKGDLHSSIKWLYKLKDIDSKNQGTIENELGKIYFLQGNTDKAYNHYKLSLAYDSLSNYMDYAEFLLLNYDYNYSLSIIKEAFKSIKTKDKSYIKTCKKAAVLYLSVELFKGNLSKRLKNKFKKKAKKLAIDGIKTIYKFYNNSIESYYEFPSNRVDRLADLASIYLSMGDEQGAEYYLKMGLESLPCRKCIYEKCVKLYEVYGILYEIRDQLDKAIECYKIILKENPGNMTYIKRLENAEEKYKAQLKENVK